MFVNVLSFFFIPLQCVCVSVLGSEFCGIRKRSRQRGKSLRESWSGYYLCTASETASEQRALIMCGFVTAGVIGDARRDRSVVERRTLMIWS